MNQVQTLRSSVAGARPTGRPPGELYTNWPDKQLGVVDATNQPLDLVAVRYFSVDANYPIGSFVVEAGQLWRSIVAVVPAPFDPAQWMSVGGAAGDFVTDTELATALADYLPLAGGTLIGPLTLAADATAPMQAVPLQQLDAYAEWAGGDFTGPISGTDADFSGIVSSEGVPDANFTLNKTADTAQNAIFGLLNDVPRWQLNLGSSDAETGGNAGSNFVVGRFSDAGAFVDEPLVIDRATAAATFSCSTFTMRSPAGANDFIIESQGPQYRQITYRTNASQRWILAVNNAAESGGGLGSDFQVLRCNDLSAVVDAPLSIVRATGVATFSQPIVNGSDRRQKTNVEVVTDALAIVEQLQGVYYNKDGALKRQVGLIAQDVAPTLPEVVFASPPDPNDATTKDEPILGVAYGNLVAVLINAVKELSAKVTALEAAA